jgi:hypothetical protein
MKTLVTQGFVRPGEEEWRATCTQITVLTSGFLPGGLRLQADRLTDQEKATVIKLTRKASGDDDDAAFDLDRLSKRERLRWERLCEVGGGREPGSVFEAARKAQETATGFAALARLAARPKRRIDLHEKGSVTLPKQIVFDFLDRPNPALTIATLGLLVFVCSQFENGAALGRYARLEGSGDDAVLTVDANYGFGAQFDYRDDVTVGVWRSLRHLDRLGLLRVERSGPQVRIRQGPKLLQANRRAA